MVNNYRKVIIKNEKSYIDCLNQLTQKEKLDDFEYMYTILKENYPFFEVNKRVNGLDWLSNKDEYINVSSGQKKS